MWKNVNKCKNQILDLLFPQFCLNCQKEGFLICPDCLSLIDINTKTYNDPVLDKIFFAASYQEPLVKKMILLFKYEPYIKNLAAPLAYLIISHFSLIEKHPSGIFMPIAIANKKLKQRGYNQSALVAKILSIYYQKPYSEGNLVRTKNTKSQAMLGQKERQENVLGAFSIKNPGLIAGETIFLVDDVFTTGATMREAASTLKSSGAAKVYGVTITREEFKNLS